VTNAISCFGCHNQGIRQGVDDIREHVLGDLTFSKEVREQVAALYPTQPEFKEEIDQDAARFLSAMTRAGLDPEIDSQKVGVESINYLSRAYEKSVDLQIAAAEFGLAADALAQGLAAAGGEAAQLKRRLEQGVLPREILEAEFRDLVVNVSDNDPIEIPPAPGVATPGGQTKEQIHDFDLALISDRSIYKVNDLPIFTIVSSESCHLTLINVDASGKGTVIFPNKFQQDNLLPAGKALQFPASDAKFQFRILGPKRWSLSAMRPARRQTASSTTSRRGSSPSSAIIAISSRGRSWWREPRRSPRRSWASKASRERARPARRNRTSCPARRSS
jgi:hypothetical protein